MSIPLRPLARRSLAVAVAALAVPGTALARTDGPSTRAVLPDLRTIVPSHLQLVNSHQRDVLRFSNGIGNTGAGTFALRPRTDGATTTAVQELRDADGRVVAEHDASTFAFHPAHNHWHIGDIALFELRRGSPTGPVVAGNSIKSTFCLIDWYKLMDNSRTKAREFWDCAASYQGISPGWVDAYHHSTPGQQLDVTAAPDADDLHLVSTSNYAGAFAETTTANNTEWVRFRLYRDSMGNRKIEVTGHSPCENSDMCGETVPNR